jgi:hypothetical protein
MKTIGDIYHGRTVDLRLSPDEARFLLDLLRKVGGCPTGSRRRHASEIGKRLYASGVTESGRPNDFVIGFNAIWMADREGHYPGWPERSMPPLEDAR